MMPPTVQPPIIRLFQKAELNSDFYQNKEMGRLSKALVNSLFLSTAIANENQDSNEQPPYSVISCNDESSPVSCPQPMKWSLSLHMAHTI